MVIFDLVLVPDPDKVEKGCPYGVKGFEIEAFKKFPAEKIRGGGKKPARVSKSISCVGIILDVVEVPVEQLNTTAKLRRGIGVLTTDIIPLSDDEQSKLKYAFRIEVNVLLALNEGGDHKAKAVLILFNDHKNTIVEDPASKIYKHPGMLQVFRALQDFANGRIIEFVLARDAKGQAEAEVPASV